MKYTTLDLIAWAIAFFIGGATAALAPMLYLMQKQHDRLMKIIKED